MVLAISTGGIVAIIVIVALVLSAGGILLYFLVFSRMKYRKQIRNLEKQFSYYYSLLIG